MTSFLSEALLLLIILVQVTKKYSRFLIYFTFISLFDDIHDFALIYLSSSKQNEHVQRIQPHMGYFLKSSKSI